MRRIIDYRITEQDDGRTIEQFLRRQGYSGQNLTLIKRMPQNVLLNDVFVYMKDRIHTGDHLRVQINEESSSEKIPPVDLPLSIIYEDEDLIIVNKPAGMPIHPSMANYDNSLANALAGYYEKQNKPFIFRCTNRLDRDTSGLTIVAKHLVSASILADAVAKKQVTREYLAICSGTPAPEEGTIDAPLSRIPGTILARQVDPISGDCAITHYKTIKKMCGHSLVALQLETGRTHQIRVHMKYIGNPLIGDYLYHADMTYMKRQALHSYRMSFTHPITGEFLTFTAPLPKDMTDAIDKLTPLDPLSDHRNQTS